MSFESRLTKLEALSHPGLCLGLGLSGLLAYARRHPPAEADDPEEEAPDDGHPRTGLAQLLAEARQWQEEHPR